MVRNIRNGIIWMDIKNDRNQYWELTSILMQPHMTAVIICNASKQLKQKWLLKIKNNNNSLNDIHPKSVEKVTV